jgi:photosystem II stability/assembly factor-like uncharacterized protein
MRAAPLFLLLLPLPLHAQRLVPLETGSTAEFRALHAPAPAVVWAAGQGGRYAVTADGGATWRADSVPGAAGLFFTGLWAADARTAHLLGTAFDGGAARIYRTDDGGATWSVQWERTAEGVFFDALRCWDVHHCLAFSDPVGGAFLVVRTTNGRDWAELDRDALPAPLAGEASFAASGTALTTFGTQHAWIGTGGGAHARIYRTRDGGMTWTVHDSPLAGGATAGIFGIAFRDENNGVAVGGDYQQRTQRHTTVARTRDGGRTWAVAGAALPHGVRYGAAYSPVPLDGVRVLLATGPSGVGMSRDDGATWIHIEEGVFNTLAFAPDGTAFVAGTDGRIARVIFPERVTK